MSYRLYTQPLTLKTESKPVDGELLIDTEEGHVLVYEEASDSLRSATKELYGEIALDEYLVERIKEHAQLIFQRLEILVIKYPNEKEKIDLIVHVLTQLENLLSEIKLGAENEYELCKVNNTSLLLLYQAIGDLLQILYSKDHVLLQINRFYDEIDELINTLSGNKNLIPDDFRKCKGYYDTLINFLNTKVSRREYFQWVEDYVSRVKASSPHITFEHIPNRSDEMKYYGN